MMPVYEESEHVTRYNYKVPFTLTPENILQIKKICTKNTAIISSYISTSINSHCNVSFIKCTEMSLTDAIERYSDCTAASLLLKYSQTECPITLMTDASLSSVILELMLGGSAPSSASKVKFTELETHVIEHLLSDIAKLASGSISAGGNYTLVCKENAGINFNDEQSLAVCQFNVQIQDKSGTLTLMMPAFFALKILNILVNTTDEKQSEISADHNTTLQQECITNAVKDSDVILKTVLTHTTVTLRDILAMQNGDIIPLDTPLSHNASVIIDNVQVFEARPGTRNNKKAIKIINICEKQ